MCGLQVRDMQLKTQFSVATDALSDHATRNAKITQDAITKMFGKCPPRGLPR